MARNTAQMSGTVSTAVPTPGGHSAEIKSEYSSAMKGAVNAKNSIEVSARATSVLYWAAAIVIASVILLWMLGGIVFKDANL